MTTGKTDAPASQPCRLGNFNVTAILGAAWVAFGAAGWVVALAGLASITDLCSGDSNNCAIITGLFWWTLIGELFLIGLTLLALLRSPGLRPVLVPFYAIFATILMFGTESYLETAHFNRNSDKVKSRFAAGAAGYILLIIYDLIAIVLLIVDCSMVHGTCATKDATSPPTTTELSARPPPPPPAPASAAPYAHNPYATADPYAPTAADHAPPA